MRRSTARLTEIDVEHGGIGTFDENLFRSVENRLVQIGDGVDGHRTKVVGQLLELLDELLDVDAQIRKGHLIVTVETSESRMKEKSATSAREADRWRTCRRTWRNRP